MSVCVAGAGAGVADLEVDPTHKNQFSYRSMIDLIVIKTENVNAQVSRCLLDSRLSQGQQITGNLLAVAALSSYHIVG